MMSALLELDQEHADARDASGRPALAGQRRAQKESQKDASAAAGPSQEEHASACSRSSIGESDALPHFATRSQRHGARVLV